MARRRLMTRSPRLPLLLVNLVSGKRAPLDPACAAAVDAAGAAWSPAGVLEPEQAARVSVRGRATAKADERIDARMVDEV